MSSPTIPTYAQLLRDYKSLSARCASLTAALNRIVSVDETITYLVVDNVLHSCSSTGAVKQLKTVTVERDGESGYEMAWVDAPSRPDSPAAIVAAATAATVLDEAMVFDDGEPLQVSA